MTIADLQRVITQATAFDGTVHEHEHRGFVIVGDGSLRRDIGRGLISCEVCRAEASTYAQEGLLTADRATLSSLWPKERIERSAISGLALCPRHRVKIEDDRLGPGSSYLAPHEAQQAEVDRQAKMPFLLAMRLIVEPSDD